MNSQEYIDFIKLCATSHPEILHRENVENPNNSEDVEQPNIRFSIKGEKVFTETTGAGDLNTNEFCVIICPNEFEAPFWDNNTVSYKDYSFNFEIAKYCAASDEVAQLSAQQNAERIGQDFCNEIKYYMMECIPPFDRGTDIPTKIIGNPTAGGKASLYGYRFEIPIRTHIPGVESHTSFTLNP